MGKVIKSQVRKSKRILKALTSIYAKRDNDKYKSIQAIDRAYHRAEELERQLGILNPKNKMVTNKQG